MVSLASPLRYPGGKAAIAPVLRMIRNANHLGETDVAEPFAGGAGAALSMLFMEDSSQIAINDVDPHIADFWWALLNQSKRFLSLVDNTPISIDEWKHQREIHRNPKGHSRLRRGFAAFYLNRCNRSGIILNGGPIGGLEQRGKWKLDARYNRTTLRERCERVVDYKERINLSTRDGLDFIQTCSSASTFLFIDPPYYRKGPTLYLNALDHGYHEALAATLRAKRDAPWVLTYDDCPEVRELYKDWATVRPFGLRYSASGEGQGRELCITPPWLTMPDFDDSRTIKWGQHIAA